MKYKVGDKVRVKSDLVVNEVYGLITFLAGMGKILGKVLTIDSITNSGNFNFIETSFYLSPEMLEPVETFNVGDVVYDGSGKQVEIVEKVWRIKYDDGYSVFKRESQLSKTKPVKKITREELAKMGYELVD